MRNLVKSLVVATILAAVAVPAAQASVVLNGRITSIAVMGTQFAVVQFNNTISGKPTCHTGANGMVVDVNTPKGRALLSLAQSAMLADLSVLATGTGACTTVGSSMENLNNLTIVR